MFFCRYEEFKRQLKEDLERDFSMKVTEQRICKQGLGEIDAFSLPVKGDLGFVVYPKLLYHDYATGKSNYANILNGVENALRNFIKDCPDIKGESIDKDFILKNVYPELINTSNNKEYLKDKVSYTFGDLSCIFRVYLENKDHSMTLTKPVYNSALNIPKSELLANAKRNFEELDMEFQSLGNFLKGAGVLNNEQAQLSNSLYVLYCKDGHYSSVSVMCDNSYLEDFASKIGGSFYIIPSSVHELLFIREENERDFPERLQDIVRSVNSNMNKEFILSDSVYYYDADKKQLYNATNKMSRMVLLDSGIKIKVEVAER